MINQQVQLWDNNHLDKSFWNKRQSRFSIELIALGFSRTIKETFVSGDFTFFGES
jgi:hypothetical protein